MPIWTDGIDHDTPKDYFDTLERMQRLHNWNRGEKKLAAANLLHFKLKLKNNPLKYTPQEHRKKHHYQLTRKMIFNKYSIILCDHFKEK